MANKTITMLQIRKVLQLFDQVIRSGHYPFYWLILATFILALVYGSIYLKVRNVYVLGIFHG